MFVLGSDASPIVNATILVGEGSAATSAGTTDDKGHVALSDAALVNGAVITASASDHIAVSYAGVTGSLVTFVLPERTTVADVSVSATLTGWDALPDPAPGKYRVARAVASRPLSLSTLDGILPTSSEDACFRASGQPAECGFTLSVHPESELLLAVIAEGDDNGTPGIFTDDALEATGLAVGKGPGNGGTTSGATLAVLSESDIAHTSVTLGSASGLTQVIGVPGVSANGQVVVFPTFASELASHPVPRAVGDLAESKLWAVGIGASATAQSLVLTRAVAAPTGSEPTMLSLGEFLAPPSVTANGEAFEITPTTAGFHALSFRGTDDLDVWILDERTSVTPPSAIDVGSATVAVSASEVSGDFHPGTLALDLTRRARQNL